MSHPAVTGRVAGGGVLLQLPGTPNPKDVSAACRLDIEERSIRFSAGRPQVTRALKYIPTCALPRGQI